MFNKYRDVFILETSFKQQILKPLHLHLIHKGKITDDLLAGPYTAAQQTWPHECFLSLIYGSYCLKCYNTLKTHPKTEGKRNTVTHYLSTEKKFTKLLESFIASD